MSDVLVLEDSAWQREDRKGVQGPADTCDKLHIKKRENN